MSEDLISFKEMCARFETTPRTLRYYEYIELLSPTKVGRSRFYGPREIARMKLILRGRHFGFSLEEIRQWLEIYGTQGSQAQMQSFVELAGRQLSEIDRKLEELTQIRADLRALRLEAEGILQNSTAAAAQG